MSSTDRPTASAADAGTASAAAAQHRSLWQELRAALRGTNADYTRIPLKRAVLLLAVPMMLELVLESTFAVVDIFFVAKLGASAVATVGLTETYLFLLYSIAHGPGDGGHGDRRAAHRRQRGETRPLSRRAGDLRWRCWCRCRSRSPASSGRRTCCG